MDFRILASLAFWLAGGTLTALAAGMFYRVLAFRRSAVKAHATVADCWTQAVRARPLEGVYRAEKPRPAARGAAPAIHAHRSRWVLLAYHDATGTSHMVRRNVLHGAYPPGQQVAVLYCRQQPQVVQIDRPLELYGRGLAIGAVALLLLVCGALAWWEVVPVAAN